MPKIGEIRKANKTGRKGIFKMIYVKCPDCGETRWVKLQSGKPQSTRCVSCNHTFQKQIGLRRYCPDKPETIVCSICGEEKPIEEFYHKKRGSTKRARICKVCLKARLAGYHNPVSRKYMVLRRKTISRGLPFTLTRDEFEKWVDEQPSTCYYCGVTMDAEDTLTMKGETIDRTDNKWGYSLDNMVLACRRCNLIKGAWFSEKQMLEIADKYFKDEDKTL